MAGGPFEHRPDVRGICRVCGYPMHFTGDEPGCPYQVKDMATYTPPGRPLASAGEASTAARELRELLGEGKEP